MAIYHLSYVYSSGYCLALRYLTIKLKIKLFPHKEDIGFADVAVVNDNQSYNIPTSGH